MKMKSRSHRYDINRPMSRHGRQYSKYKKCLTMMVLTCISNTYATFEAQFMKKLNNTEVELEKCDDYKKRVYSTFTEEMMNQLQLFFTN